MAVKQEINPDIGWELYTGKRVLSGGSDLKGLSHPTLPQTLLPCQHL